MSDQFGGIAIVGMAGRFPGAKTVEELWANLVAGKECVSFFTDADLAESGLDATELRRRGTYVQARGVLQDADCFDAAFFGIHPKEAEVIDPQQRVFLEACWTALERAGYAPGQIRSTVGVFAGATFNTYYQHVLQHRPDLIELIGSDLVMFGNEKDYLTTRVAYKLGLKGPALNVSTACSTSLVAVCQACQSLMTYQCDMALAGGVSVTVPQKRGYYYDEGNIGSPDGHTRTFDMNAAGTVFSNGVGVVVLKRLEDALRDGDSIYAVIKGAALNNDGSQRVSFGAPGVEGQAEVVATAHAMADVDPETITYVEAHGTATPLGDPIEVAGLTKAFRMSTAARQFCAIGSVKTNLGHLDAAAGVTGLIKTALALYHKTLPASLHFTRPNPKLDLENTPFFVNSELREWTTPPDVPRRAGVSSFGTGGTNAHVVVEEAPETASSGPSRPSQLLALSAKTPDALDRATDNLSGHLREIASNPDPEAAARDLADTAFVLLTGRSEFVHRRIVACSDSADGAAALESRDAKRVFTQQHLLNDPAVVFMFPGQGAQYAGMGAELYRTEPVYREAVDQCAGVLNPLLGTDIRILLFPAEGSAEEAGKQLVQTRFTQPALFTTEYALAKLWMSWGVKPAATIGHSVGEYVAACLSGVFTLEDALSLVARRADLVQAQPGGAMLAIRLPETEVLPLLNPQLAVAAINSPNLCVVAGPYDEIDALEKKLVSRKIVTRHLHTSHAFHSPMMDPVLEPFTQLLRGVKFGEPRIPFVSNVTARWITSAEARKPEYWAGHVRQTVRFADGIAEMMKDDKRVLLEVGPGQTLSTLARQHPSKPANQTVLASLSQTGSLERRGLLETLGRLWMAGVPVDWQAFYASERRRPVVAPTYPFERKRYWPEAAVASVSAPKAVVGEAASDVAAAPVLTPASLTPVAVAGAEPAVPRKERLLAATRTLLEELSGYDLSAVDPGMSLMELGLDSLLLTQASQLFQRKFGVPITFRQLMEELGSMESIALHLDATLPPEAFAPAPAASTSVPGLTAGLPQNTVLEQILQQQQQLTNQILQLMGRQPAAVPASTAPKPPVMALPAPADGKSHGPFKPIQRGADMALSVEQSALLNQLIARYQVRTAGSKKLAEQNRPLVADPRSVSGFKQLWKEIVYPIYTVRSDGSKVWDVDGNEYVDFVMGFGASMFGHRPPFVVKAIHEQLDLGFEIGPIQPLAGTVAALVRELTGMQRVGFTNTGSEAVLAATRVARTVTGRDKIAVFAGAYHGIFDEVLFRPLTINGETRTAPIAPGIPQSALNEVIVLDYGNPQSLEILRARGSEIAAVLVEPVQSRRLDLQPKEFLHELRQVTEETGSALIFDEVVTGFRLHQGGAQAYFGVRADLATYGKVIGGGVSIGLVTGDPKFMDALDGGQWQYGDASFPEVGVTFFAGTFVRHPLALAAANAVLTHLKEAGPQLQTALAERTVALADELRGVIREFGAPYQVTQFTSLIQVGFPAEQKLAGLLFYLLRERGIHIYENRAFVLTTAHTEEDLARLVRAFRESLSEMCAAGLFTGASVSESRPLPSAGGASAESPAPSVHAARPSKPAVRTGQFPLTEAQREIWLAAQMGGDAALGYNESLKLEFRGPFDCELFAKAARHVVSRHPILMAKISPDGQWQEIGSNTEIDVPLFDVSSRDEGARQAELQAVIDREISEPFDFTAGCLLRVRIVRLASEDHVVVWTAHHIVCDGWSGGLLVHELAAIYSAWKEGKEPALEQPASFEDYVTAANADSRAVNQAVSYWRDQYTDLPAPLDLPIDHSRPAVRSARASTLKRDLSTLHRALKRTAGQQRTTLVVLLMAGIKTLLYRLTGQTDIVIGLGVAGQAMTGSTSLVGHCVNLLPIRTGLQEDRSFQENLALVKKNVLDGYDHHQATLGGLLQHLKVPRLATRPPLVEVIFNVDRDPGAAQFYGVEFACDRNPKRALHFDLFFNFVEGPRGIYVECDYNADLFDAATIERWLHHFETLMDGATRQPATALGKLPVLTDTERFQLTSAWNPSRTQVPRHQTLHDWFGHHVQKTPTANALTFEGEHWTYAALNQRANQVAHYLRQCGVGPNVLVGLFLERSVDIVVGILAILKAGGAYLPIDPVYPKERLAFMLEDADAPVLLTQSKLASELPRTRARIICFDTDSKLFDDQPQGNPESGAGLNDLAYVIYTSGSTGKPKGSRITHYNVIRLMQATEDWYHFDENDVWTFFHSHAFDFSVWEIWGALLYGGRLVIVPYLTSRSPEEFYALLVNERVTVLNQTPSAFRQLIDAEITISGSNNLSLRYIIFGGEALEMHSLKPWFDRHGDNRPLLVNMYGITETTVHVTYRPLSKKDLKSGSLIGVPIPDLRVYILDRHQQPVPIGVAGEIYVGGAGVAAGYLNREELTRQRFLPDSFTNRPGATLYRTGDLARYLPDRQIEYIGRIDNQVKIRGFRIELGEVEAVLSRHPAVRQCLVLVHEDSAGGKMLVAYIETNQGYSPAVQDLRSHLTKVLPDYMVPSAFVLLPEFPLTPNGKIDRKTLPSPDQSRMETVGNFLAPRDSVEQVLTRIWSKVLGVRRIGIYDNFFELGGHSLLALRIVAEIEKIYKQRLPLATLLQAPTIDRLAEIVRREKTEPSWSSLVPIQPGGSRPPVFLFHSHGGNVLEYYPLANHLDPDQPVYALQARGLDGHILNDRSLEEMAAAYIEDIKRVQPEGPYFLGGFCFGGLVAAEAAQQLRAAGQEVALLAIIQTTHPAANRFKPETSLPRRWWYRFTKRLDLERQNLTHRETAYLGARLQRVAERSYAKAMLAFDRWSGKLEKNGARTSMTYVLEALAIEHDKAFERYQPRPYYGNAVLFRASHQMRGLIADALLGWKDTLLGKLEVIEIPGHQQNILAEPHVARLAADFESALAAAQEQSALQPDSASDRTLV